jgi:hypothetical protein
LDWRQTPLPSSHPTCCDNIWHYILFIKYFILNITKTFLKIHILLKFCSNEMIRVYFSKKFNNVHNYIFTFFESLKSFEQKKSWISLFNNISMTILLNLFFLTNGIFFVDIIILPMLNYFQLLYDHFSLFHPTLFTAIYGYSQIFWLFLAISP